MMKMFNSKVNLFRAPNNKVNSKLTKQTNHVGKRNEDCLNRKPVEKVADFNDALVKFKDNRFQQDAMLPLIDIKQVVYFQQCDGDVDCALFAQLKDLCEYKLSTSSVPDQHCSVLDRSFAHQCGAVFYCVLSYGHNYFTNCDQLIELVLNKHLGTIDFTNKEVLVNFSLLASIDGVLHDLLFNEIVSELSDSLKQKTISSLDHLLVLIRLGKFYLDQLATTKSLKSDLVFFYLIRLTFQNSSELDKLITVTDVNINGEDQFKTESSWLVALEECIRIRQSRHDPIPVDSNPLTHLLKDTLYSEKLYLYMLNIVPSTESSLDLINTHLNWIEQLQLFGSESDNIEQIIAHNQCLLQNSDNMEQTKLYLTLINNVSNIEMNFVLVYSYFNMCMQKWTEEHRELERMIRKDPDYQIETMTAHLNKLLGKQSESVQLMLKTVQNLNIGLEQLKQSVKEEEGR